MQKQQTSPHFTKHHPTNRVLGLSWPQALALLASWALVCAHRSPPRLSSPPVSLAGSHSWDLSSECQPLLGQQSTDLKGKDIFDQSLSKDEAGAGLSVTQEDLEETQCGELG